MELKSAEYMPLTWDCSSTPVFASIQDSEYGEPLAEEEVLVMEGLEALKGVGARSVSCGVGTAGGVTVPVWNRMPRGISAPESIYKGDLWLKKGFMGL